MVTTTCQKGHMVQIKKNNNNDTTMKKTWSNSCYSMCSEICFDCLRNMPLLQVTFASKA
jgi:hypothetical protein